MISILPTTVSEVPASSRTERLDVNLILCKSPTRESLAPTSYKAELLDVTVKIWKRSPERPSSWITKRFSENDCGEIFCIHTYLLREKESLYLSMEMQWSNICKECRRELHFENYDSYIVSQRLRLVGSISSNVFHTITSHALPTSNVGDGNVDDDIDDDDADAVADDDIVIVWSSLPVTLDRESSNDSVLNWNTDTCRVW